MSLAVALSGVWLYIAVVALFACNATPTHIYWLLTLSALHEYEGKDTYDAVLLFYTGFMMWAGE